MVFSLGKMFHSLGATTEKVLSLVPSNCASDSRGIGKRASKLTKVGGKFVWEEVVPEFCMLKKIHHSGTQAAPNAGELQALYSP